MRLRAVMGSVLALVLLVTVASGQGRQAGPPLDDDTFPPTMAMLQGMLDLTPDQVEAIAPLRETMLVESEAMRLQAKEARAAFMAAKQAGAPADSLEDLQNRARGSMMALMPYRMRFMEAMKPYLTDEQATIMEERHKAQMAKMQEQMGKGCQMGQGQGGKGMGQGQGMGCTNPNCPCKAAKADSGSTDS